MAALLLPAPVVSGRPFSDAPVASDPVFTALTTDGGTVAGRVRQFSSQGDVTLATPGGPDRVIPLKDLVKLTKEGPGTSLAPETSVVLFPGGDRLYHAAIGAANETTVEVQSNALGGNVSVPLDGLLGVVFSAPQDSEALASLVARVRDEPRTSEVLWLANGDRLPVGFLGLSENAIEYQAKKQPEKIDRSRVLALGFDPTIAVYPAPAVPFFELTLSDGSRLGVTGPSVAQGHVVATTRFGAKVRVPLTEVVRVHARTPSISYLAERPVAAEKYVPYVGPSRPFRRNANVEGQPFKLSGQEYDRGIGTQSRTLLAYRLEKGDRRFQCVVGLDDRAGPLGSVVFRVLLDKREAFVSPPMSAGDAPRSVDLDLTGATALVLVTEFGDRGGVRDLADWVEARILR